MEAHQTAHKSECCIMARHRKLLIEIYDKTCTYFPQLDFVTSVPTTGTLIRFGTADREVAFHGGYFRFPGGVCSINTAIEMLAFCSNYLVVPASGDGLPAGIFTMAASIRYPHITILASDLVPNCKLVPTESHDLTQRPLSLKDKSVLVSWMDTPAIKLPKPISLFVVEEALRERSTVLLLCSQKPGIANSKQTIDFLETNFDRVFSGPPIKISIHNIGYKSFGDCHATAAVYKPKKTQT
jgi:hypothetical protein